MPEPLGPGAAMSARSRLELSFVASFEEMADRFLREVLKQAKAALSSPVLLAAGPGRPGPSPNPFAYTNVVKAWRAAIAAMVAAKGLPPNSVAANYLMASNLPSMARDATATLLTQAREEGWTDYKTKRALSAMLVPKATGGQKVAGSPERAQFMATTRMIARSAATSTFNRSALEVMSNSQAKQWVSHHDRLTRPEHAMADGQVVPMDAPFRVGGYAMDYPGDSNAPIELTANCRCVVVPARYPDVMASPLGLIASLTSTAASTECEPCAASSGTLATNGTPTQDLASTPPADVSEDAPPASANWAGVLVVEGELTGDGRLIEPGALVWDVPQLLRYAPLDVGAHDGAQAVGHILSIERRPGGVIWGTGDFDLGSEIGREAYRQVQEELTTGISVDLDDVSFEIRVAGDLLAEVEGSDEGEVILLAADPPVVEPPAVDALTPPDCSCDEADDNYDPDCDCSEQTAADERPVDDEGRVTVMEMASDEEIFVTTSGRVRAATMCQIPAFASARIALTEAAPATDSTPVPAPVPDSALAAGATPLAPPSEWFANPYLNEPTPLTITEDGRVYGHIAAWNVCHTSHTAPGQCVLAPHSNTNYSGYRTGSVLTREGSIVSTGRLTLASKHAPDDLSPAATAAHYENTATAVADVAAGDDAHGIWVAGCIRPGTTPEQIFALRASPISGDWRRQNGNLELVAALAVNVAGFPIPRPHGLVASGELQSLVAAGMLAPAIAHVGEHEATFMGLDISEDDLLSLRRMAARERRDNARTLSLRVKASALAMRAHGRTTN